MPIPRKSRNTSSFSKDQMSALERVLQKRLDMDKDDAKSLAKIVSNAFAGKSEIQDADLNSEVRNVFYTLEEKKIMAFRKEGDGGEPRFFYWRIRWDNLSTPDTTKRDPTPATDIYSTLPPNAWTHKA